MGFNADSFAQAALAPRTREVPVLELADWFEGRNAEARKAAAVFRVRGLTSDELARAKDAHAMHLRKLGLLQALGDEAPDPAKIATEARSAILGGVDDKHSQVAMRQEMLRWGVIDPTLNEETAAKIAQHFPLVLYRLSDAINDLTGRGSEAAKKQKRSSETAIAESVSD